MILGYSRFFKDWLEVVGSYDRPYKTEFGDWDTYEVPIYANALPHLAKWIRRRRAEHYQTLVFCAGSTGSGKSNTAIKLCREIEPNWSVEKNYILTKKELFSRILDEGETSKVMLIDEASYMLNSKNSTRSDDKSVEILFDIIRSWSPVTVMCAPDENRVNHGIMDTHVDLLLKVPEHSPIAGMDRRGFVDIYTRLRRDWGKPAFTYQCTTLVDQIGPRVKKRYEDIKRQTQREFLMKELEKCG